MTATAIGIYTAFQSIAALIASSLAGVIWYSFSASAVFLLSGVIPTTSAIYILQIK